LLSSSFVLCFLCRVRVTDTDFCSLPGNRCHHNATCVTLSTRHACVCNTGFRGDGKHCHGNITRRFCYAQFTPPARHEKTLVHVRSASECVRRSHRQCLRRPTHSVALHTCRAVGPTQFTPTQQTRQDGPVCIVSGVPVLIGRLL